MPARARGLPRQNLLFMEVLDEVRRLC